MSFPTSTIHPQESKPPINVYLFFKQKEGVKTETPDGNDDVDDNDNPDDDDNDVGTMEPKEDFSVLTGKYLTLQ